MKRITKTKPAYSLNITCKRCKTTWELQPHKWRRNPAIINGQKILVCPYCNCKQTLNSKQTRELMLEQKKYRKSISSGKVTGNEN